jgi:hypothetical protein
VTRSSPAAVLVLLAGAATTAAALLWWGLTYWPVWSYDYLPLTQAGRCLVQDSTICRLAASLCTGQHRTFVSIYSPLAFWAGAMLLVGGLGVRRATGR